MTWLCDEPDDAVVLIICEACGGEGKLYVDCTRRWDFEPRERCIGECSTCEGTGYVEAESYPVELDDLPALIPVVEPAHA